MSKPYVIIDGHKFFHGDPVTFRATPNDSDEEEYETKPCDGRISVVKESDESEEDRIYRFHVCQNEHDGDSIEDKLGYEYSWVVSVGKDGSIHSTDTAFVIPRIIEKIPCSPCDTSKISVKESETFSNFDDDVMPDDWEFDLTQLKKELDENP